MRTQLPRLGAINTVEAREYVGSRALLEYLISDYNLKPIYVGAGRKSVIYRIDAIDVALSALQLNGGWDVDNNKPIKDSH